jgi:hypothetical protein
MNLYVIYENPIDHPSKWAVRRFELEVPKELIGVTESLEEARKLIPEGMHNLGRNANDDWAIYEVWI